MIDQILEFWRNLPLFLRFPIDFVLGIIIMRGVVAKDVTSFLEDKGIIKKKDQSVIYRTLDGIYTAVQKILPKPGRKSAIWNHFKLAHTDAVDGCQQGSCTTL